MILKSAHYTISYLVSWSYCVLDTTTFHSGTIANQKLQQQLKFKPCCFRCRCLSWSWGETSKAYQLICENCGLEVSVRKSSLRFFKGYPLPIKNDS